MLARIATLATAIAVVAATATATAGCAGTRQPPPGAPAPAPAAASGSPAAAAPAPAKPAGYDAELARRLGADEYGMHPYVMALLKEGPDRTQSPEESKRLMQAHLANIDRLAEAGSLVVAGPFLDKGPLRGIYIFKVATVEEARALTATDPAIQAGRLEMELHPWYGSAALQEVNGLHKQLQKKSILE